MEYLQTNLTVLQVEKPVIAFNYEIIKNELKKLVGEYKGTELKEDDLDYAKALLANLNKLKKNIDDFRKTTKKELNEPISVFENQCKELTSVIDDVYSDIKNQYDDFEEKRRQQKLIEVQELIKLARDNSGLPENYLIKIEVKNEYLNKTMTISKIAKDLESIIDGLKKDYQIEIARNEQLKNYCDIVSLKLGLDIPLDYKNFCHIEDIDQAKVTVDEAGQRALRMQEETIRRIREQEEVKARKEAERLANELARAEIEKAKEETRKAEEEKENAFATMNVLAQEVDKIIPEVDVENQSPKKSLLMKIEITDEQLKFLENYMDQVGINFEIMF